MKKLNAKIARLGPPERIARSKTERLIAVIIEPRQRRWQGAVGRLVAFLGKGARATLEPSIVKPAAGVRVPSAICKPIFRTERSADQHDGGFEKGATVHDVEFGG